MYSRVGIIAVIALALTAGCLGVGEDPAETESVDSTVDDDVADEADQRDEDDQQNDADADNRTEGEDDETDAEDGGADVDVPPDASLPAGVDENGIHDVAALLEANEAALSATSYEIEIRHRMASEWVNSTTRRTIRSDADDRMHVEVASSSSAVETEREIWIDDETYIYEERNGDRNYSVVSSDVFRSTLGPTAAIESLLDGYEFELAAVEDGRIVLESMGVADDSAAMGLDRAENASATVVLDENGRIHAFEHAYEMDDSSAALSYDLERTGDVSLEKPAWTDEARAASTMVDLSVEREDDRLLVTHEGGDVVENGTNVGVSTPGADLDEMTFAFGEFETDFEPGDTAYVALAGDADAAVTVGEPPTVDAQPLPETRLQVSVVGDGETVEVVVVDE